MTGASAVTGTVQAPGARLFCKLRGSGPCLMMLGGGPSDADGLDPVAERLAAHYTVVTYDRRGLSRSVIEDSPDAPAISIATHSEDAHRVLASLGAAPALVFGSSIGGLIGLDLLIRHPGGVRLLVAHEPPAGPRLAPGEKPPGLLARTYAETGDADAAVRKLAASLTKGELPAAVAVGADPRRSANNAFFITKDLPAVRRYGLDLGALRARTAQLVIGGGRDGRDSLPYARASSLAGRLGTTLTEFPGGHAGYAARPEEFAGSLHEVLRSARPSHE